MIKSQESGETIAPPKLVVTPRRWADSTQATSQKMIPNLDYAPWRCSNRLLRGWITCALNEDVLSLVVGLETSKDVWIALHDACAQDSQEREFLLTQKLQMLRKGTSSLSSYLRDFKNAYDNLL